MIDRASPDSTPETILASAIAVVARGRTPDEDLARLVALARGAVAGDLGSVFLWDAERGALALAAAAGLPDGAAAAYEAAVASSADHPIARTAHGQTAILGAESVGPDGRPMTVATWPLRVAHDGVEEPIGALAIGRAGGWAVGEADATLLAAFADLIAITVDRTRLVEVASERADWAERISHTDALTGLANARTLSRVLELEVARSSRQGTDLSVVLFDVDGLAAANDAGGPAVGDDILREVAAVLAETVRLVDTVARWGGDEFLLVAPGAAGMIVAQRVLDAVAARPAIAGRAYSVSAGVARFPADGASPDELVAAAGAALATAKGMGPGALASAGAA
ncbi:MAG: GGDEF domain-containing protein [Chloroflexota bacterium]|nr:MAG: GGDEF domain-containing protein [Chloroflexota bacterium]